MNQPDALKVFISHRDSVCDETNYDELLSRGHDRSDARHHVQGQIEQVLRAWAN